MFDLNRNYSVASKFMCCPCHNLVMLFSTDYWYILTLQTNKLLQFPFALSRRFSLNLNILMNRKLLLKQSSTFFNLLFLLLSFVYFFFLAFSFSFTLSFPFSLFLLPSLAFFSLQFLSSFISTVFCLCPNCTIHPSWSKCNAYCQH